MNYILRIIIYSVNRTFIKLLIIFRVIREYNLIVERNNRYVFFIRFKRFYRFILGKCSLAVLVGSAMRVNGIVELKYKRKPI